MRVRQSRNYCRRYKPPEHSASKDIQRDASHNKACQKCTYTHDAGRCPADGRRCNTCGLEGHFTRSPLCKKAVKRQAYYTARRVEEDTATPSEDSDDEYEPIARIERTWPGVAQGTTRTRDIHYVKPKNRTNQSKRVSLKMGGHRSSAVL